MKKNHAGFLLVFALFWTAMVLLFDGFIGGHLVRQILTLRYTPTEGRILRSELTRDRGSDGTTYGVDIRYEYHVDDRRHESDRVRFGQGSDSDGKWARETLRQNPPGALRTVYHDPANPALSVLQRGPDGQNWFLVMLILPFNAVAVFLWSFVVSARRAAPPRGGARVSTEASRLLVHLNPLHPLAAHLCIWGGFSFAGVFLIGFTVGFSPPSSLVWSVWLAAAVCSALALARKKPPAPDLVIDAATGHVELSRSRARSFKSLGEWRAWRKAGKPLLLLPFDHIRGIDARDRGDGESVNHVVTLTTAPTPSAPAEEHDVGSWMLSRDAEAFAAWLRETLHVPATHARSDASFRS